MVYFSKLSLKDIDDLVVGLLTWRKHELSIEFVQKYRDRIVNECKLLGYRNFHFNTQYSLHKQFGQKVFTYKRSKQTVWYIVYNLDSHGNVFIQRIFSNHTTAG